MVTRVFVALLGLAASAFGRDARVIFIASNNHGEWTFRCYRNDDIHTSNIDRLAREGVRFFDALVTHPVRSPNRVMLLTGWMPARHAVHSLLGCGAYQMGPVAHCVIDDERSLNQIFMANNDLCIRRYDA